MAAGVIDRSGITGGGLDFVRVYSEQVYGIPIKNDWKRTFAFEP